jgi:hypothetical protein
MTEQIPEQRERDEQHHGHDRAPADAVHSRTSYSNAHPRGHFPGAMFRSVLVGKHLEMIGVANFLARIDIDQDGHCFLMLRFKGRDLKEPPRRMDAFLIDAAGTPMSLAASSRSLVKRAISIMRRSCLYENTI